MYELCTASPLPPHQTSLINETLKTSTLPNAGNIEEYYGTEGVSFNESNKVISL